MKPCAPIFAVLAAALGAMGAALGSSLPAQADDEPFKVVATIGMIADVVRNVAGDHATVKSIIGQGVDPHLFRPTRADVVKMLDADIIFYNGLLLEGKMTDALIRVARKKPVIPVTEELDEADLLEPPEFLGHFDPHVWMDPAKWALTADVIAEELAAFDPDNASAYRDAAEAYKDQLRELDAYAREVLASVPPESRVLVTAHDAFNYLARSYGFEVLGIQGISTESEAGVRDIERIVNIIVERNVRAVFVETTVSDRNVKALIEGAAARGHDVVIGGSLYSDAMGAPGTYEGTYIGMIDHNVTTIARALGGTAPEHGLRGKAAD